MLKAILNNPYRVLGVFADAKESDILSAADRLMSSPDCVCETDFSISGLPKPRRDADAISNATKVILDSDESCVYKSFWFIKPSDEECMNYLKDGKLALARTKLTFNTRIESKHNLLVCCLIEGMYDHVARIAYRAFNNQDYRQTVLLTKKSFQGVLAGFKDKLYDASNDSSVPVGLNISWKQYLQDMILKNNSNAIAEYLEPARQIAKKGTPSAYYEAIDKLMLSYRNRYLQALKFFVDNTDSRYLFIMSEFSNSAQKWIEEYLSLSHDFLKHRYVKTEALTFSVYAPDKIQASYFRLIGNTLQNTGAFLISSDICEICNSTAYKLFHFYSERNISSASYRSLIEQTAFSFYKVQRELGQSHVCYRDLANLMAEIGLEIIDKNLAGNLSEQTVADCGDVFCYIGRVIDERLLYDRIREKCDLSKKKLWPLGLGPENKGLFPYAKYRMKWQWDTFIFDDDTHYQQCSTLGHCQSYLRRFPNGKHAQEAKARLDQAGFGYFGPLGAPKTTQNVSRQDKGNEKVPIKKTVTQPTRKESVYSSSPADESSLIKSISVYRFILIALIVDVILGILIGNTVMLGVGLAIAFAYILFIFLAEKGFDRDAKKLVYIYVIAQTVVSIVGLLILV